MNTKTDLDDALADLRVSRKITEHTLRVFDYLDSGLLSTNLSAQRSDSSKKQKTSSEENE